jgi:hypothetical protein
MFLSGQSRPESDVRVTSALLLITTEQRTSHEVGSGSKASFQACDSHFRFASDSGLSSYFCE